MSGRAVATSLKGRLQYVFACLLVVLTSGSPSAGLAQSASYQTGRVTSIFSRSYDTGVGLVYVVLDGPRVGAPACASGNYWMIADEKSENGKREVALLTSAYLSGRPVTIIGRRVCTRWIDGEDIHEIVLQ